MAIETRVKIRCKKHKLFVGDICYALQDNIYTKIWCDKMNGAEGIIKYRGEIAALVGYTAYGDGTFYDNHNVKFDVDAGNIGVVNLDFPRGKYTDSELSDGGVVVEVPSGEAYVTLSNNWKGIYGNFYIDIEDLESGETLFYGVIPTNDEDDEEEDLDYSYYYDTYEDEDEEEDLEESNPFKRKLRESGEGAYYFLYEDKNGWYHQEDGIYRDLEDALRNVLPESETASKSFDEILSYVEHPSKNKEHTSLIGIAAEDSIILEPTSLYDELEDYPDIEELAEFIDDLERSKIDLEIWHIYREDYLGYSEPNYDKEWEERIW